MNFIRKIFYPRSVTPDGDFFIKLKEVIGANPKNLLHYEEAFTHRSMDIKNAEGYIISYERLEFLGDAILGTVVADFLFKEAPKGNEGYLTKMRSKLVSREHLNQMGKDLDLLRFLKSNIPNSNFGSNIYGNIFEALIGAIYIDLGFEKCEQFILKNAVKSNVDLEKLEGKIISYKSLLIEWCQKKKKPFQFIAFEDDGNEKQKHFGVKLLIEGKTIARARATSKKKAEEKASQRAYFALQKKITD